MGRTRSLSCTGVRDIKEVRFFVLFSVLLIIIILVFSIFTVRFPFYFTQTRPGGYPSQNYRNRKKEEKKKKNHLKNFFFSTSHIVFSIKKNNVITMITPISVRSTFSINIPAISMTTSSTPTKEKRNKNKISKYKF